MVRLVLIFLVFSLAQGCSLSPHYDQLMALKGVGDSQAEIQNDAKKQKESFFKLKDSIKNNHLKKGMSKNRLFFNYGEPVFCRNENDEGQVRELCVYRLPGNNFNSGLIYLYFNQKRKLDSWELISRVE